MLEWYRAREDYGAVIADSLALLKLAAEVVETKVFRHRDAACDPTAEADRYDERPVVHVHRGQAQAHLLVRATAADPVPRRWEAHPVGLEELTLAYLREPRPAAPPDRAHGRVLPPETAQPPEVAQ